MTELEDFPETISPSPFLAEYRGSFLNAEGRTLDAVLRVAMEIAGELWVVKERNRVLEEKLVAAGVLTDEAVEMTHLSPAKGEARRRRTEYVDTIFRHLLLDDADDPLAVVSPADVQTPMHGAFKEHVKTT
ncbi:hypothetical protein [Nocardioides sp. W7]|uniref:hypothetical protein n=1 Tax=Nocardioides sp. W7 TaxID=2931390 RepID=UPI001FD440F2|nr:hypothetical protein [Nocardioides sp. W7]